MPAEYSRTGRAKARRQKKSVSCIPRWVQTAEVHMLACCSPQDKRSSSLLQTACHFLAKLGGQHAQGHQRALGFTVPWRAAIEANAVIELFGVTEDQTRRNTDALLQCPHVQFLRVDSPRQTDPQNEATGRPGHLRAFRKILLHGQLEGTEVLTVFLTDEAQMPVVPAIFQVSGNAHLGDAARR